MTLWYHRAYHIPSLMQFNLPWLNAVAVRSLSKVWLRGLEHTRLLCPPLSPGVCSDSCLLSQWCYLTISSSATPFSFWLQSFPASGSFPVSQFLTSDGQSIGVSASASVLPMNIKFWFPLGWTAWISWQYKTLKSLIQHHSSKASVLQCSAYFIVQLSHPYMSRFVITFLPRRKRLFISWLQSPIYSDFGAHKN